jgi:hypothetical protein
MMIGTRLDSRILGFAATLVVVSLGLSACNMDAPTEIHRVRKTEVTINLRPLGINRSEKFKEVRANALPETVLAEMEGVADAGEPFNASDDILDPGLPRNSLIVAAVSERYCALTYLHGGIGLTFNTMVFELSDVSARPIWHSLGQGGLYLEDLKEMIESGRMRNDLPSGKSSGSGIAVLISAPDGVRVPLGGSMPVKAVVTGTRLKESGTKWSISIFGFDCSSATCGEMTEGAYRAPSVMPRPPYVHLTAISKADPSAQASITLHIVDSKPSH